MSGKQDAKNEFIKRMKRNELKSEVRFLYSLCSDLAVEKYFDIDSDKMLAKKKRVLTAINNGEEVSDEDYYSILEFLQKDKNGKPIW